MLLNANSAVLKVRVMLTFGVLFFCALALWACLASEAAASIWVRGGKFPLYFIRNELNVVQMKWLWSLDGLRVAPLPLLMACAAGLTMFILAPQRCLDLLARVAGRTALFAKADILWRRPLVAFFIAAALCGVLMVDPEKNILFGDGYLFAHDLRIKPIAAAEVGTSAIFWLVHWILKASQVSENMDTAIRVVSCLCGGLYALGVSLWTRGLQKILSLETPAMLLLYVGGLVSGACVLFFGYVETTQVVAALIALLFGALAQFSAANDERERKRFFCRVVVIVGLAVCAHSGAISLFPMLAIATILAKCRGVDRPASVVVQFAVLPIVLVLAPFYGQGDFGNAAGGGDGIMFVPFNHIPLRWPRTDYLVYYSMLSWVHLADIANAVIVASPLAIFSLATIPVGYRGAMRPLPQQYSDLLVCAAAATLGCGSIVALWNFDFGMWGDWNLCTAYLLPLHFCSWTILARFLRSEQSLSSRIPAVLLCQFVALLGLAYQLW